MTISDRIAALIRTLVPALYGVAITWAVGRFPAVQDILHWLSTTLGTDVSAAIEFGITALVIAGYYAAARALGAKFPALEKWLLGSSLIPVYTPPVVPEAPVIGVDTGIPSIPSGE